MAGRGVWLAVLALLFCAVVRAGNESPLPTVIHLASEEWEDYTGADGRGLGWDVLRAVFEPVGVKVDFRTVPYTRSVGLAQLGEVDACVGAYRDENEGVLYPRWNFDTDQIYALGLVTSPAPTAENIGSYRLAWVRGYKYQNYLPNVRKYDEVVRRTGILSMLTHSRTDFYIDALPEIDYVLGRAKDPTQFRKTRVAALPLYLCFANNPKAKTLMTLFDQRMELLVKSGALKPIFERWKQPYPFAPQ